MSKMIFLNAGKTVKKENMLSFSWELLEFRWKQTISL